MTRTCCGSSRVGTCMAEAEKLQFLVIFTAEGLKQDTKQPLLHAFANA